MGILDKLKRKNVPQNISDTQNEIEKKNETAQTGNRLFLASNGNDNTVIVLIRTGCLANKHPKDLTIIPPDGFVSFVAKDGVYSEEPVEGYIKISEYSDGGKKHIKVLSYCPGCPFSIAIPASVRIPGGTLNGIICLDVSLHGNSKQLNWFLDQSLKESSMVGNFVQEYLTAGNLKELLEPSVVDILKNTFYSKNYANGNEIYDNRDEISAEICERINSSKFFVDKAIRVMNVHIKFEVS